MMHSASELKALSARMEAMGLMRKPEARACFDFFVYFLVSLAGSLLVLRASGLLTIVAGVLLIGMGGIAILTSGHTASHHGISNRRWLNILLTYVAYPFFFQVSALYWWRKHVALHHPAPNVVTIDEDWDFLPFFATSHTQLESSHGLRRVYFRAQWLLLPLMLTASGFNVQYLGWRHLVRMFRRARGWNALVAIDLFCLAAHWIVFFAVPLLWFPLANVLAFWILRNIAIGMAIFFVAAPAHLPEDAPLVDLAPRAVDHLQLQTNVTLNYAAGPIGRFFICGSEYQIEHHLFPGLSHLRFAEASPLVEAFCRDQGYPYRTLPWGVAIWKSLRVFWRAKPVVTKLDHGTLS